MILRRNRRAARRTAFTLVEMLVVVAIIVVLAGIAVPTTLYVLDGAKRDAAQSQCKHLAQAVHMYMADQTNNPSGAVPTSWDEVINDPKIGLNADALKDPWGNQYQLVVPTQHNSKDGFDVLCTCGGGDPVGSW
ncbi:MAG TPA: type II secretion system protein GspG [Gemmataceae bacterium]|nr:type II secretion system protein GspG [Gemmataceae bacterium]